MRARDLLADFPTVTLDTAVIEAARLLADQDLPGLIVVDERGLPVSILPGTQVLRLAVPGYCQDDPALARVVDEAHADALLTSMTGWTVREALPARPRELPVTDPEATVLELAALMARTHSPLVAVVGAVGGGSVCSARSPCRRSWTGCWAGDRACLAVGGGLSRRLRADRHRTHPSGGRRARRRRDHAADPCQRRRSGVLQ
ncbi:CBS domain-containing protein [Streptosporangium sp. NPDC000396]|uniref:CBS domain-containing protein n=1 Tax=Streptosporangium sp. NPDC000396 TaxID=3366185 RepID=UPI0036BE2BC1